MLLHSNIIDGRTQFWLFVLASVVFVTSIDYASTGDTIVYANLIDTSALQHLTLHQGYYILGWAFASVLRLFYVVSTDQALALMSAFFAALSLIPAYILLVRYLGSTRNALIGAVVLATSYRFFSNATTAEIYIIQACLLWSGFLAFECRRFVLAGAFVALAMWITPLTVFFLGWFPATAWVRKWGWRPLLVAGAAGAALYLPFFALFHQELLWGERGLLKIDEISKAAPVSAFGAFFKYQFKHYTFLIFLILPAIMVLGRNRQLLWPSLAVALPNAYVIANLPGEDNVFLLGLDLFFVVWIMWGWQRLREQRVEWIAAVFLLVQVALLVYPERLLFRVANSDYPNTFRNVGRVLQQHERPLLLTDWTHRVALSYYNRGQPSFPLESGLWFEWSEAVSNLDSMSEERIAGADAIYVIDDWQPSSRATVFRTDSQIERTHQKMSDRLKVERHLGTACHRVPGQTLGLYRCR